MTGITVYPLSVLTDPLDQSLVAPTRTNAGPLTTTFTPGPRCSTPADYAAFENQAFQSDQDVTFSATAYPASPFCQTTSAAVQSCLPPAANGVKLDEGRVLFSPGLICPLGWSTALTASYGQVGGQMLFGGQSLLVPGETAALCCPDQYTWSSAAGVCAQSVTTGMLTYLTCDYGNGTSLGTSTVFFNSDHKTTFSLAYTTGTAFLASGILIAPTIQLNWREQDIAPTQTAHNSLVAASGPSAGFSISQGSETAATASAGATSTGATANSSVVLIVVLCTLFGAIVSAAAAIFWIRRQSAARRRNRSYQSSTEKYKITRFDRMSTRTSRFAGKAELDGRTEVAWQGKSELGDTTIHEMDATSGTELDGSNFSTPIEMTAHDTRLQRASK